MAKNNGRILSTQESEATRDLAEVPGYPILISLPGCLCVLGEILGDTILPHRMDHSTGKQKTQLYHYVPGGL